LVAPRARPRVISAQNPVILKQSHFSGHFEKKLIKINELLFYLKTVLFQLKTVAATPAPRSLACRTLRSSQIDGQLISQMVGAISKVGRALGMATVAEWVETDAVLEELRRIGLDCAQGFLLAGRGPVAGLAR
jgi:hypothetical protein